MPTLNRHNEPKEQIRRDPYRHIYQSSRWHRFSKAFLKDNRLCAKCKAEGIVEVATVTDHIIPLVTWIPQGGDPYDTVNCQPLSKRCHDQKTANENKGWNKKED